MDNKKVFLILVGILFLGAAIGIGTFLLFADDDDNNDGEAKIENFEDCKEAGYAVLESQPRQCITPEGVTFRESDDEQMTPGVSSPPRPSTSAVSFQVQTSCTVDSDCEIMNQEKQYACCWTGACERIDYSESKWIAVNSKWYQQQRTAQCPSARECGPAPLCSGQVSAGNQDFVAQCLNKICQKVSRAK